MQARGIPNQKYTVFDRKISSINTTNVTYIIRSPQSSNLVQRLCIDEGLANVRSFQNQTFSTTSSAPQRCTSALVPHLPRMIWCLFSADTLEGDTTGITVGLADVEDLDLDHLDDCMTSYQNLIKLIPSAPVYVEPTSWPQQIDDIHGTLYSDNTQLPSTGNICQFNSNSNQFR